MDSIRHIREKRGLSQAYVAGRLELSQQAIAKWESGEAMPRADKLPQLAKVLECSIDDLFRATIY